MVLILSTQDFNSTSRAINLPAPISPTEPVRLQDLNAAVEGISWKNSCRVAATSADINIASPGATIDGIVMSLNDRVLLTSQTNQAENGIYIWNGAAVGLTRSLDASTSNELESATTLIEDGSSAGTSYRQTTIDFVLGTQAVIWTTFGTNAPASSTTTAGILRTATQAEVDAGTVTNAVITPATLANYAARVKKFAVAIGDGTATTYAVNHNLNSLDVVINVYRVTGGGTVIVDTDRTSANAAQITFASAPSTGAYRVVVIG